uniref:Uncharacterized protein n=1 Tax=Meloidogyne floridensis TaxID=298350 RepID=A0A915P1W2_9BILA
LERLADYYIQGLTNLDDEANLKIFYSASILAQVYKEDEIQENLNKKNEKALKNQKNAPNYWNLCKKTISGRVDSFIDKDLEYCIYISNGELNYLYYLRNLHSNNNILDENFKGMIDIEMFKKSNELKDINEQMDMIRTSHRYIFDTLIVENPEFLNKYEKIGQQGDIGKLMYDMLHPETHENLENDNIRCPKDDKNITYKEETQLIRDYLSEPKDEYLKLINASSLALHYELKMKEIIKPYKSSKIIKDLVEILKIKNPKEKLCRLYFFLNGDIKNILNYKEDEEWQDYLKKFGLKIYYSNGPTLANNKQYKINVNMTTANIIAMYNWPKDENELQKIIYNYLEFVIIKYPDMHFLEMDVALSYYEQYVQNPIESPISIEAIKLLNARLLLVKIKNKLIYNSFEENNYLYNIFKKRLDLALNEAYHKFREFFSSDERLCFMIGVNNPNHAALLINIWTGSYCRRKIIHEETLLEAKELVSYQHSQLLKDLSSEILQKCTSPGMLSKLDFLSPNVTVQEYFEVDSQWIF